MANTTQILGIEATLAATAINVGSARVVRIHNTGTGVAEISIQVAGTGDVIGKFTMVQGEVINLQKASNETIKKTGTGTGVPKVVKVGFTN
jgi:hypothetical protein